jgi:hypothetical protein
MAREIKVGDYVTVTEIGPVISKIIQEQYSKYTGMTFKVMRISDCWYYVDIYYKTYPQYNLSFHQGELRHATKQEIKTRKQRLLAALV